MNPKTIAWITGLTLYGLSAAWTGAQTVTIYKCVVDGKVMLQQTPCLAGDEKRMEVYTGQSVDADQEAEVRKAIDWNVKTINSQTAAMRSLYDAHRQDEGRPTVKQEEQINAMRATARQFMPDMSQFNSARAAEQQRLQASAVFAGDNRYEIKTNPYGSSIGGSTEIEMRRKNDYDPSNRFRGEVESDGSVRMRNYNGDRLRGEIDSDGYGKLRDQDGNTYRVKPR